MKEAQKKTGCCSKFFVVPASILIVGFIAVIGIFGGDDASQDTKIEMVEIIEEDTTNENELYIDSQDEENIQSANDIQAETETENNITSNTEIQPELETASTIEEVEETETIVYITNTGSKYHRENCRYLDESKIKISLSSALSSGYEPCGTCKPLTEE